MRRVGRSAGRKDALKKVAALIFENPAFEPIFFRPELEYKFRPELEYKRARMASETNIYSRAAALLNDDPTPTLSVDNYDGPTP